MAAHESLESITSVDLEAARTLVGISADDGEAYMLRILPNSIGLIFRRIFLMLGRHADVFGRQSAISVLPFSHRRKPLA